MATMAFNFSIYKIKIFSDKINMIRLLTIYQGVHITYFTKSFSDQVSAC